MGGRAPHLRGTVVRDPGARRLTSERPIPAPPIERGRTDVWLIDLADPAFLATAGSDLPSEAERARAASMTDPEAGRRLLARRATLRLVLSRYVGKAPEGLRIVTAPGGKPVLLHGTAFSVAHSGSLYAIGVTGAAGLGLDIEQERPVPRAGAIADRWFASAEARRLEGMPEDERPGAFMRLWCAKEALAKRHGAGLRLMTRREEGSGGALDVEASVAAGCLRWFDVREGYVGAVASTDPIEEIRVVPASEELWTT